MTWTKISDEMPDRPSIWRLSHGAFRLHVSGLAYCNRLLLEGVVPEPRVPALIPQYRPAYLEELVAGGIWARDGDHLWILDSADDQLTKADVLALREKRAAAGRKGGLASSKKRRRGTANVQASWAALAPAPASDTSEANGNPGPVPGLRVRNSPVSLEVLSSGSDKETGTTNKGGLSVEELEALVDRVPADRLAQMRVMFGLRKDVGFDALDDQERLDFARRLGIAR